MIKAATQAKRRAGVAAGEIVFDVESTTPIPAKDKYQSFIRVPGNRDKVASHLWQHITTHPDRKGRHPDADFIAFGVAPLPTDQTAGEDGGAGGAARHFSAPTAGVGVSEQSRRATDGRGGASATGCGVMEAGPSSSAANETREAPPLPVFVWKEQRSTPDKVGGPGIGEGELSTTHAIIHHSRYTREDPIKSWMVTSVDNRPNYPHSARNGRGSDTGDR